jgi:hypothetical protein
VVYYILKPQWSSGKIYAIGAWRAEFGPEGRHFVSGNSLFLYFWGSREAAMGGGGARSAPFGVLMGPKRQVRAAHGRARAAKTH